MQPTQQPITKDLVFIGGGHSHAIVLRMFAMNPLPGVRITLISDVVHTPYSGMLPGYIAGFYDYDQSHIDLRPLANFAGAQFYRDRAVGLDLANNRVICANRPPVAFDILSIDIGSTPATLSVPGAADYAIPAKPVPQLLQHWHQLVEELQNCQLSGHNLPETRFLTDILQSNPQCRGNSRIAPTFGNDRPSCFSLGIVGGGAGGVELALSMSARLNQILGCQNSPNLQIHLFQRSPEILPNHNTYVRRQLHNVLSQRGINLHLSETVSRIESGSLVVSASAPERLKPLLLARSERLKSLLLTPGAIVHCESGLTVECDRLFWVTQASAPDWLRESGLSTDADGFIKVSDTLQSISHSHIFAAGDIATMIHHPRPKAGVFAVRQGQPLYENLRRILQGQPLKPFKPQKQFLTLIGTGEGSAIASRGAFGFGPASFLWHWKDWIDRQFMDKFRNFPEMSDTPQPPRNRVSGNPMRCAGCGAKVGSTILERVLNRISQDPKKPGFSNENIPGSQAEPGNPSLEALPPPANPLTDTRQSLATGIPRPEPGNEGQWEKPGFSSFWNENILIGLNDPDDCAVVKVPSDKLMVHTIDYFPALINDPFIFGQISANHSLSDIFAMGATPQTALAIATIPHATEAKTEETLYQLLAGATKILEQSQTSLVGGHTTEGKELAFGLACNGFVTADKLLRKSGMQPGQVLILTKALGTGTLFAADMQKQAKGRWIENAIDSMLLSNQPAAECLIKSGATACTDITGFGLLGHLMEMIKASEKEMAINVEINLEAIAILDGATQTVARGILSSLHPQNFRASDQIHNLAEIEHHPNFPLLFDPQTSGGLLASIPQNQADDCLAALKAWGYPHSNIIGQVKPGREGVLPIKLL